MVEDADSDELMQNPAMPYTRLQLSAVPNLHAGLTARKVETRGEFVNRSTAELPIHNPLPACDGYLPLGHARPGICRAGSLGPLPPVWARCYPT
ncbi:MAG: hypothetical protein M3R24_23350 [Chloroflexota bacterium]|nr:hypothetical protein [Chloroflexota bacterium]